MGDAITTHFIWGQIADCSLIIRFWLQKVLVWKDSSKIYGRAPETQKIFSEEQHE